MNDNKAPESDDDPVVNLVMAVGLPGFCIGLVVICAAIFCISHRIASLFFPGA